MDMPNFWPNLGFWMMMLVRVCFSLVVRTGTHLQVLNTKREPAHLYQLAIVRSHGIVLVRLVRAVNRLPCSEALLTFSNETFWTVSGILKWSEIPPLTVNSPLESVRNSDLILLFLASLWQAYRTLMPWSNKYMMYVIWVDAPTPKLQMFEWLDQQWFLSKESNVD